MSQIHTTKKKSVSPAARGKATETISKSDMLHMSGAGAPQPMSPALREKFEPGFGADFSNIRISRGHIPEELGVQAVAKGTDILVDSRAGMNVLGHELAHVVQQAQGRVQGGFPVVENAALEHEADVMGARVASGMSAMESGMNGLGGEMMSIAPMSDASAPAQCKSKKDKGKEPAAAPTKTRGDLFKEDYASRDLTGQVALLREYTNVLTGSDRGEKSEEDAYYDILGKATPELMDEILRQKEDSAKLLMARNKTDRLYESDAGKADFNTALSGEADDWQAFELMLKNLGMGTRNDAAYGYFKGKEKERMENDSSFNDLMLNAEKLQKEGLSNGWAKANSETANELRDQWDEDKKATAKRWDASREAMLAPAAAPAQKKHRFRRWLNK